LLPGEENWGKAKDGTYNMEKIKVVGLGPGNPDYILPAAEKEIKGAEIVIGGKRNIESIKEWTEGRDIKYIDSRLGELTEYIKENRTKKITVIVSGDPGFYSMLNYLENAFGREELFVIPGISSVQYMFARLGMYWYDAFISSLHGKEFDFVKKTDEYEKIGLLTDKKFTPQKIAEELCKNKKNNIRIFVGENLSYENEKIQDFLPENLCDFDYEFGINVVILVRK
jgi:cobalt-precorrin-7 (C5)-methyltransferase